MSPLISVVIPCYNRRHTICQAVDSVLRQTVRDFEVLIVDDASTDELDAALAAYAADGRVRSLRLPSNGGPGAARNAGVAAATGRFVAFLDSDDAWLPEKLRAQLDAVLAEPDPDNVLCVTRTKVRLGGGREIVRPIRAPAPGRTFAEYLYLDGGFAQTSSLLVARSLARRFPFHEGLRQLEDHLFFMEVDASGAKYLLVDQVLTVWWNGAAADRASNVDDVEKWIDIIARFEQCAGSHLPPPIRLAAEVRILSGRLWRRAPARSLRLLLQGLASGALSPPQAAALLGRNVLQGGLYDRARHWLDRRGDAARTAATPSCAHAVPTVSPQAEPYRPEHRLSGKRSVLFVTEEPFLPPRNGSQQTYASVARAFNEAGWTTYCISFFRDPACAASTRLNEAYRAMFADHLLVPGWNCGGAWLGRVGQALREADRALTGNVLASHPFLITKNRAEATRIVERVRSWDVGSAYVHKVHSMQLLGRALEALEGVPIVLDIHDDFVVRAMNYDLVHKELFPVLPLRSIVRDHASSWLRHRFARTSHNHSRKVERDLLQRCDLILVGSAQETANYLADETLAGKIVFSPVLYDPPGAGVAETVPAGFDAGFIGSQDAMNLHALLYFRDEIWPRITDRLPGFRFLVAGRIVAAAKEILQDLPGVTLWDRLDNVADFYSAVRVSVIPVRYGTGVSVRFLEAMRYGTPVVSTTVGVRGLASTSFETVVVTDDPVAFANAVAVFARQADPAVASREPCSPQHLRTA